MPTKAVGGAPEPFARSLREMGGIDGGQHCDPLFPDGIRPSVVNVGWNRRAYARMAMLVVVPAEESATVGVGVLEGSEGLGEVRPALGGAEVALGIRVVVA